MRASVQAALATVLSTTIHASAAHAAVEPPAVSDARSAALGGTGVAYSDNGAAVFHNPAGLAEVEHGALTLSFSPFMPRLSAPFAGTVVDSERSFFPMFLAGGAFRISDSLVAGLAVYPVFGFGAEYVDLEALGGESVSMSAAAFEASPALAYSITDNVSLGVAYRATYMLEDVHQVAPATDANGEPVFVASDLGLSGMNFFGLQVGLQARVAKGTRLGLTFRNKVTVDLEGELEAGGAKSDAKSEFSSPHTFKLGVAQELLDERIMVALDLKYALYSESSETSTIRVEGVGALDTPLEWEDSIAVSTGVEYRLAAAGPAVRAGYSLTTTATPKGYPQPFLPPPGLMHSLHLGGGMKVSKVALDLGAYYLMSKGDAESESDAVSESGEYSMNAYAAALSASYLF